MFFEQKIPHGQNPQSSIWRPPYTVAINQNRSILAWTRPFHWRGQAQWPPQSPPWYVLPSSQQSGGGRRRGCCRWRCSARCTSSLPPGQCASCGLGQRRQPGGRPGFRGDRCQCPAAGWELLPIQFRLISYSNLHVEDCPVVLSSCRLILFAFVIPISLVLQILLSGLTIVRFLLTCSSNRKYCRHLELCGQFQFLLNWNFWMRVPYFFLRGRWLSRRHFGFWNPLQLLHS